MTEIRPDPGGAVCHGSGPREGTGSFQRSLYSYSLLVANSPGWSCFSGRDVLEEVVPVAADDAAHTREPARRVSTGRPTPRCDRWASGPAHVPG